MYEKIKKKDRKIRAAYCEHKEIKLKNILAVGRAHRMDKFYASDSGFSVVGITLEENLEYKLDFANREGVPAEIKEIVEENIANVRAQLASQ